MISNTARLGIASGVVVPGGVVGYYAYDHASVPADLREIMAWEEKMGGCEFWFVKEESKSKGWYREEVTTANEIRSSTDKGDKLQRLFEQLAKGSDESNNSLIESKCKEKKGLILEIKWRNDKWEVASSWAGKAHKRHDAPDT